MTRDELHELVAEHNEDALLADGFEDAAIGIAERCSRPALVVYDIERCIEILMRRDGMTYEGAAEHLDYNVLGAWMGEGTPLFLHRIV